MVDGRRRSSGKKGPVEGETYSSAGVDLRRVKEMHRSLASSLESTFETRRGRFGSPLLKIGHYAGLIDIGHGQAMALHTDSVGTKIMVAIQMEKFDTIGIDCIAMTVNDLICLGCEPVALLDYIALEREDEGLVDELAKGLVEGAKEAGAAIVGGETAVLGEAVKGFDLVSMGVGVVRKDETLDGSLISQGDRVVGVASSGLHSNGYTLARKVLLKHHSVDEVVPTLGMELGAALLAPTSIYVRPALAALHDGSVVHGIAHITGGSFAKLTRLVGGRDLEFDLSHIPSPPPLFRMIQEEGRVAEEEMYRTFNMGIGLCAIVPPSGVEGLVRTFGNAGFAASEIGTIRRRKGGGVRVGRMRISR